MSGKKAISGPYRATKLWNDAVRTFYNGMPVARHWRGLRQYDRCFTATEAIDWLHSHLRSNPNFGSSVSREQTTKLLRKFVKAGLIEDVRGNTARSEEFKDNKELYRFSNKSPLKALRTPRTPGRLVLGTINSNNPNFRLDIDDGASPILKKRWDGSVRQTGKVAGNDSFLRRNKSGGSILARKINYTSGENAANEAKDHGGMQECHIVAKPLSKLEVDNTWQEVFLTRLDAICNRLLFSDSSTLLDPSFVNGEFLHHNMTKVTARGVVQAPEGHPDDLPNWILTAMKCMAHWPNTADSSCNIPNYPGVERDVFKIVRDFFTNLAVPLIPYTLYEAFIRLYIGAEFLDIAYRSSTPDEGSYNYDSRDGSCVRAGLEGGDSVENLILNMSISSQQKTSTPNMENENLISDENSHFNAKRRSTRRQESSSNCENELHTPTPQRSEEHNLSNLRSLKLRRLKNYTDFKEDSLYPSLLEGSNGVSSFGHLSDNQDISRTWDQQNKASCESVVLRQPETVRSVKTNDYARRMKRENKEAIYETSGVIRSNDIEAVSLPQNCCFETAFTSDSPKTRIIPQKSVDTIHLKQNDRTLRPRPISIAVTSLVGLDTHSSGVNLWDTTREENISKGSDIARYSAISSDSSGQYVTAPINSPLSRSKSAVNLQSLGEQCNTQKSSELSSFSDVPYRSLASRLLDSVKRKNNRNALVSQKRPSQNKINNEGGRVRHLRTKSGGYINPVLATAPSNVEETRSIHSHISDQERDSGLSHLRTKSGGFLNLALIPSNNSLDQADSFDTCVSAPTPRSDYSLHDDLQLSAPQCYSSEGHGRLSAPPANAAHSCLSAPPAASANAAHSRMTTPDGCLSHSLSSSSSLCTSGRSLYYSAHSCTSRSSTPNILVPPLPERSHSSLGSAIVCSTLKTLENNRLPDYVNDADLSKNLSSSANELSDRWADRTPYGQVPPYAQGGVWRHYHSSPSKRLIGRKKGIEKYFGSKACLPGLLTREGKESALESTRLLLLILTPVWRRKLHLLLRMMSKMASNEKLNIHDKQTTRALVLNTFTRSILLCGQEADYDEVLSLRIVSFMMDNHEEIMRPPQDLSVLVHRKLSQIQRSQIVYDSTVGDRGMTFTYCHQVSQAQYDRQRMTGSQQFLAQLLEQIITNEKLTNKEKRKKLKEFKSLYPEVYKERFPNEQRQKTENRSSKIRNLMKFSSFTSLGRSRTLRL